MKKQLLITAITLIALSVFAQQKKIDSLNELLKNFKEHDTMRLNILNSLANNYETVDANTGLVVSDQAIDLANALNNKEQLAKAYINKAYNYMAVGKDSLALKLFYKAIDVFISKNNMEGNASALYGIARIHQNWSDYDTAIKFYIKAYQVFESMDKKLNMAKTLNGIGICYMYSSNYPKALETFMEVLHIYEMENQTESLEYAHILSNIGLVYNRMQTKLVLALKFHDRALKIYRENDYKTGVANVLGNMANAYDDLKQPLKAIELQHESYKIHDEIGNKTGKANALTNIGIAYTSIPDFEKAIYYLEQTLPIYQELGNKNNLGIVEYYLGKALLEIPLTMDNTAKAENYLNHAIKISKETGNLQTQVDANDLLATLYAKKGDFKKAFQFKEIASVLHDSLSSQDLKDEITRLEVKYEYDKKAAKTKAEHDINQALAEAEIKRQKLIKNGSILGGSVLVAMSIFGMIVYKRKRDAVAQTREAQFKAKVSETELKALRAQINPHFVFNSLNSINDYISKNDAAAASNYLTKFAKIMRQTLENSNQSEIALEDDLKLMDLYLQIEKMRLKDAFSYTIKIDESIDAENTLVPPLILQPFIENSIWHGISKKKADGHILVEIKKEDDMLICTVDDNGVGRALKSDNDISENRSMGTSITKSRIDIINKIKDTNGSVRMIDKKQGLQVEVRLPLQLAF